MQGNESGLTECQTSALTTVLLPQLAFCSFLDLYYHLLISPVFIVNYLVQGVVPTAQRAAIVVGVELPVYDITKKHLIMSGMMGDTILTHFM